MSVCVFMIHTVLQCTLSASGKDKLAEMLSMNSNAAKELMTSFLGNFKQSYLYNLPVSNFQCIKL